MLALNKLREASQDFHLDLLPVPAGNLPAWPGALASYDAVKIALESDLRPCLRQSTKYCLSMSLRWHGIHACKSHVRMM